MGQGAVMMKEVHENSLANEVSPTVEVGKVVTIMLGDNEKTFFVANEDQVLPSGAPEDILPSGVMITELDAPIVKDLLGMTVGDAIEPENEAEIPRGQGYRKLGVRVIGITSLEEFLASSDSNDHCNADNKPD